MNNNSTHTMRVLDKDMHVIMEREYTRPAVCHSGLMRYRDFQQKNNNE